MRGPFGGKGGLQKEITHFDRGKHVKDDPILIFWGVYSMWLLTSAF